KSNRPVDAIKDLEQARLTAPSGLRPQVFFTLGLAYEAVRDEDHALEAYAQASNADPRLAAPRLARVRLLQARSPIQAAQELTLGLVAAGDDVALIVASGRLELNTQRRLPKDQRSWR